MIGYERAVVLALFLHQKLRQEIIFSRFQDFFKQLPGLQVFATNTAPDSLCSKSSLLQIVLQELKGVVFPAGLRAASKQVVNNIGFDRFNLLIRK